MSVYYRVRLQNARRGMIIFETDKIQEHILKQMDT